MSNHNQNGYILAADRISDYLALGMHHSTTEAKEMMTEIIAKAVQNERKSGNATMKLLSSMPKNWRCYDLNGNFGDGNSPTQAHNKYLKDARDFFHSFQPETYQQNTST